MSEDAASDPVAIPESVPVRLDRLAGFFDEGATAASSSAGQLSSLIGEELLIELVADWLSVRRGLTVSRLPGKPIRDESRLPPGKGPRDLDAWLLAGSELVAVEAKMWTVNSLNRGPGNNEAERAAWRWNDLQARAMNGPIGADTKVFLPLRQPPGAPSGATQGEPVLAIWRAVSPAGSDAVATTMVGRNLDGSDARFWVFSGSRYVAKMREDGHTHLRLRGAVIRTTFGLLRRLECF